MPLITGAKPQSPDLVEIGCRAEDAHAGLEHRLGKPLGFHVSSNLSCSDAPKLRAELDLLWAFSKRTAEGSWRWSLGTLSIGFLLFMRGEGQCPLSGNVRQTLPISCPAARSSQARTVPFWVENGTVRKAALPRETYWAKHIWAALFTDRTDTRGLSSLTLLSWREGEPWAIAPAITPARMDGPWTFQCCVAGA
jgi:hypothetical protein